MLTEQDLFVSQRSPCTQVHGADNVNPAVVLSSWVKNCVKVAPHPTFLKWQCQCHAWWNESKWVYKIGIQWSSFNITFHGLVPSMIHFTPITVCQQATVHTSQVLDAASLIAINSAMQCIAENTKLQSTHGLPAAVMAECAARFWRMWHALQHPMNALQHPMGGCFVASNRWMLCSIQWIHVLQHPIEDALQHPMLAF